MIQFKLQNQSQPGIEIDWIWRLSKNGTVANTYYIISLKSTNTVGTTTRVYAQTVDLS